jgi:hypothetical protein
MGTIFRELVLTPAPVRVLQAREAAPGDENFEFHCVLFLGVIVLSSLSKLILRSLAGPAPLPMFWDILATNGTPPLLRCLPEYVRPSGISGAKNVCRTRSAAAREERA